MKFTILSLFPESFGYFKSSILSRAQKNKKIFINILNPRAYTDDKHKTTDSRAYGGGPGMVMKALPLLKAVQKNIKTKNPIILITSPTGTLLTNSYAKKLAYSKKEIVIICGRYEGIDARVKKALKAKEISIGPYVLTGGEIPAMAIVDAVSRHIPGVLGKEESLEENRVASPEIYTRPESFIFKRKKYNVPKILLSGNHKEIEGWRKKKLSTRTKKGKS